MKKTKIISFANHKGGVGKTTTTASVGSILASMGRKILLVDMDPQANLTTCLLSEEQDESIYYALTGRQDALPVVPVTSNLDLVPSSLELAAAEIELVGMMSRETILRELLEPIQGDYDFILIDCPPSLGLLALNGTAASNEVIVPVKSGAMEAIGLKRISDWIDTIRRKINPDTHLTGILLTIWEGRLKVSRIVKDTLDEQVGDLVFKSRIRKNAPLLDIPLEHRSIMDIAPDSYGDVDYHAFVDELLEKLGEK